MVSNVKQSKWILKILRYFINKYTHQLAYSQNLLFYCQQLYLTTLKLFELSQHSFEAFLIKSFSNDYQTNSKYTTNKFAKN